MMFSNMFFVFSFRRIPVSSPTQGFTTVHLQLWRYRTCHHAQGEADGHLSAAQRRTGKPTLENRQDFVQCLSSFNSYTIDHGRSDEFGCLGELEIIARFIKLKINFLPNFSKRPSFSGANWKSQFIRVSRDLWLYISFQKSQNNLAAFIEIVPGSLSL